MHEEVALGNAILARLAADSPTGGPEEGPQDWSGLEVLARSVAGVAGY